MAIANGRTLRVLKARHADDGPGPAGGDSRRAACRSPVRWTRIRTGVANALVGNADAAAALEVTLHRSGAGVRRRAMCRRRGRRVRASRSTARGRHVSSRSIVPDRGCGSASRLERRARNARRVAAAFDAAGARQPRDHLVSRMGGARRASAEGRDGCRSAPRTSRASGSSRQRTAADPTARAAGARSACSCRAPGRSLRPTASRASARRRFTIVAAVRSHGIPSRGPPCRFARRRHHFGRDAARRRCRCRRRASRFC